MKKFSKVFVGKGVQNEKIDSIVRVTLDVETMSQFFHEFNGKEYLTFEIARLQEPDKFGRTHTAYVVTKEEVEEPVKPVAPLKTTRRLKKVEKTEIPF